MEKKISVKYFDENVQRLQKIEKGDWIDLRSRKTVILDKGGYALIPLGVAMKLPDGYEAHIAPRSSTFKNFGIIQTNSVGVVDNSYSGDNDEWLMPVYALRDTVIEAGDRICQFRIIERQPEIVFETVEHLSAIDRGGIGSTGTK